MSINKCFISGNLTRSPELRSTAAGTSILTFGMAVNDRRKNPKTNEWEDCPNFIDCVVFGSRAEPLNKFLSKGTKVAIEGKLRWSQWEKDGQKRSKLEVIVDECEFFLAKGEAEGGRGNARTNNYSGRGGNRSDSAPQQPTGGEYYDEDCPF